MDLRLQSRKAIISAIVIFFSTWSYIASPDFVLAPDQIKAIARSTNTSDFRWVIRSESRPNPEKSQQGNLARALIDSIKDATRLASGAASSAGGDDITAEEREAWNRQNPCLSRAELIPMYDARKYAKKLPANPLWDEVLTEYSKLHRACTRNVGNLTEYFLTGNVSTGCKFVVSNAAHASGLGNKIMVTVSSLLYAILTQRILLVVSSTLLPSLTCEPFLGSSWILDSNTFPVQHFSSKLENASATLDTDFFKLIDEEIKQMNETNQSFKGELSPRAPPASWDGVYAVREIDEENQPFSRFYCSTEQAFFSEVTWVSFTSYFYTIPRLFAAPPFRPTLEALFPDKMAATRLFRSVFLPSDVVWDQVLSMQHAYIDGGDRVVGIQMRYRWGFDYYTKVKDLVNERVDNCIRQNAILPDLSEASHRMHPGRLTLKDGTASRNPVVKVFIASLYTGLEEHLSKRFLAGPTSTGEDVAVIQISQNNNQVWNSIQEDKQALAEILLLSLSDQLLVSPLSTFGGVAQAYGALTPWFIEIRDDKELPSCERGKTVDICNMLTDKTYRCPYDPVVNERPIFDLVPYMKDCLSMDEPGGMQMITDF